MKRELGNKNTGIIVYPKRTEESERLKGSPLGYLVKMIYFYLGIYGALYGVMGLFSVNYNKNIVFWGVFLLGLVLMLIHLTGRFRVGAALVTAVVYGILLFYHFDSLLEGDMTKWILFVGFLWESVLFLGIMERGRLLSIVNVALPLAVGLAIGRIPGFYPLCMMVMYTVGCFAMMDIKDVKQRRNNGIVMAVAAVIMLLAAHLAASPVLGPWFDDAEQIRFSIQNSSVIQLLWDYFPDWQERMAAGGVGNGDLNHVDGFDEEENREVAVVTAEERPKASIYLRCYVGGTYTGDEWREVADTGSSIDELDYFALFRSDALAGGKLVVEAKEKADEYDYRPYFSSYARPLGAAYQYDYFPINEVRGRENNDRINMGTGYHAFVYQNYLSYPAGQLSRLEQECLANPQEGIDAVESFIVDYLSEAAAYNLQVGKFPENEEFTEYFLFEKKEGYCVHFATSAALMFRMYGVPSRFATGYIVPSGDFYSAEDGYRAEVKSSRAHAWVEVYLEESGWTPVEATPAYVVSDQIPDQMTERESQTQAEMQSESEAKPQEEIEEDIGYGEWVKIGAILLAAVLLVLGMICFCLLRRRRIIEKRKKKPVAELFHDMVGALELAGLPRETQYSRDEFVSAATATFPWFKDELAYEMMEVVIKANFADEDTTETENWFMRRAYRYICRKIYRKLSVVKRFLFRYVYAYY